MQHLTYKQQSELGKKAGNAKNAYFKIMANCDLDTRKFRIKKGQVFCSRVIDNYAYYDGCTGSNFINAVAANSKIFSLGGSSLPVSAFDAIGWSCYHYQK